MRRDVPNEAGRQVSKIGKPKDIAGRKTVVIASLPPLYGIIYPEYFMNGEIDLF
jgi:hypothetical protein